MILALCIACAVLIGTVTLLSVLCLDLSQRLGFLEEDVKYLFNSKAKTAIAQLKANQRAE